MLCNSKGSKDSSSKSNDEASDSIVKFVSTVVLRGDLDGVLFFLFFVLFCLRV